MNLPAARSVHRNVHHPLSPYLLGAWVFDHGDGDQIIDRGPLHLNCTKPAAVTWASMWPFGFASYWTGSSGNFPIGASNKVVPYTPSGITMATWAWHGTSALTAMRRHFTVRNASGSRFAIGVGQTLNKAMVCYRNAAGSLVYLNSTGSVSVSKPHFFCGTLMKERAKLYLDGVLEGSATDVNETNTFNVSSANSYLGSTDGASDWMWDYLYMVLLFSKALEQAEVLALYQDTQRLFRCESEFLGKVPAAGPPPSGSYAAGGNVSIPFRWGLGWQ